jgi:crotonobetainyl-CoA:carnitine CoA-transferase CaiB-like acyl-CoA transferase
VLDLSRVLAGPWATQLLGDLGADVIKLERPDGGDDTRQWGPPYARSDDGTASDVSAYFLSANRNKRSVVIDLACTAGRRLALDLAARCDVVIENFKVGGAASLGIDYARVRAVNPSVIYCSITGFGQTGPYAQRPGYDAMVQAMGGLMSLTGAANGAPTKVGVALVDVLTGLYASNAILAAVAHRARTGEGQFIDVALLDVQVAALANQALNYLTTGVSPMRLGNAHPSIVPYQDFATRDGRLMLAVGNDAQFARFCTVAGVPELAGDVRFATNASRVKHREELVSMIEALTCTRTSGAWVDALEAVAVPCGAIRGLAEVFNDPQVEHRELARTLPHARLGSVPTVAAPMQMSATPVTYRCAPPDLGEHTEAVLREVLALDNDALATLRREGAFGT